jgi:hypothetical protein
VFDCFAEQPDFTHAWFPREMFMSTQARWRGRVAEADDAFDG